MAKLNSVDQRLLKYPPTQETWVCRSPICKEFGGTVNSGKSTQCFLCTSAKPEKPKLLWPRYLQACKKAGVEPKSSTETPQAPPRRIRTRNVKRK